MMTMVGRLLSSLSQLGTEANPAMSIAGVKVKVSGKSSILQLVELYHEALQLCVVHLTFCLNQICDFSSIS